MNDWRGIKIRHMLATCQNHKLRRIRGESQKLEIQKVEMWVLVVNYKLIYNALRLR
jgi:hypothetical protein